MARAASRTRLHERTRILLPLLTVDLRLTAKSGVQVAATLLDVVLVGGGNWLYATPGIAILAGRGLNVQAEVKLPVYRSLANTQLDFSAILQIGVSRSF